MKVLKPPTPTEHEEQVAVIRWHELAQSKWPELKFLHAIPNAGAGAQRGQAGKMKAEGVKPGVPDLFLPVRRAHAAGLYIEMKRVGAPGPSNHQVEWLLGLQGQGFSTHVCHGAGAAIDLITNYLKRPKG